MVKLDAAEAEIFRFLVANMDQAPKKWSLQEQALKHTCSLPIYYEMQPVNLWHSPVFT